MKTNCRSNMFDDVSVKGARFVNEVGNINSQSTQGEISGRPEGINGHLSPMVVEIADAKCLTIKSGQDALTRVKDLIAAGNKSALLRRIEKAYNQQNSLFESGVVDPGLAAKVVGYNPQDNFEGFRRAVIKLADTVGIKTQYGVLDQKLIKALSESSFLADDRRNAVLALQKNIIGLSREDFLNQTAAEIRNGIYGDNTQQIAPSDESQVREMTPEYIVGDTGAAEQGSVQPTVRIDEMTISPEAPIKKTYLDRAIAKREAMATSLRDQKGSESQIAKNEAKLNLLRKLSDLVQDKTIDDALLIITGKRPSKDPNDFLSAMQALVKLKMPTTIVAGGAFPDFDGVPTAGLMNSLSDNITTGDEGKAVAFVNNKLGGMDPIAKN